jgi:protein TonB
MVADRITARAEPAPPPPPRAPAAPPSATPDTLTVAGVRALGLPDSALRPLAYSAPKYPEDARRESVQGVVVVMALVDTAGAVVDGHVVQGILELNDAALAAVRRFRFPPLVARGRPWFYWVEVPVRFTLH